MDSFKSWIEKYYPDAYSEYQMETKEELALFSKYVENLRIPNQECLDILQKIKEMNLL